VWSVWGMGVLRVILKIVVLIIEELQHITNPVLVAIQWPWTRQCLIWAKCAKYVIWAEISVH
jgi:hypothetical protein